MLIHHQGKLVIIKNCMLRAANLAWQCMLHVLGRPSDVSC